MKKHLKYLPYAFTEQGVTMLATILRTPVAESVSIQIMDAFVIMRKYISNDLSKIEYMNHMLLRHDDEIKLIDKKLLENKLKEISLLMDTDV